MAASEYRALPEGALPEGALSGHDLPEYATEVREEWIDYNGHLSEAYYVLVFGFATDQAMEVFGMDAAYRERTGSSLYTVEAHVRYLQEVALGARLRVRTVIAGSTEKKLHLAHEMYAHQVDEGAGAQGARAQGTGVGDTGAGGAGTLVATEEILGLHVGGDPAGVQPFPAEVSELIARYSTQEDPPSWVGRALRPL